MSKNPLKNGWPRAVARAIAALVLEAAKALKVKPAGQNSPRERPARETK